MIRIVIWYALLMAFVSIGAQSTELPRMTLSEGESRIVLTLDNRTGADLPSVTVSVDDSALPSWLTVRSGDDAVSSPAGELDGGKLILSVTLTGAPPDAEAAIPLTFRDAGGGSWRHTLPIRAIESKPITDALIGNYPNPFNPSTTIAYSLAESRSATITIHNALGQTVRTFRDIPRSPGRHAVLWDGRDDGGRPVSSGVYYGVVRAGSFRQSIKMLFMQ